MRQCHIVQLHQLRPTNKQKPKKRVGRGGKRGTYAGRGLKGQKSRAGASVRASFRGGDTPLYKLFPKKRGATKGLKLKKHKKKRTFMLRREKPVSLNVGMISKLFSEGMLITPQLLLERKIIKRTHRGVKILSSGFVNNKLKFEGFLFSQHAREKIKKAGGEIK